MEIAGGRREGTDLRRKKKKDLPHFNRGKKRKGGIWKDKKKTGLFCTKENLLTGERRFLEKGLPTKKFGGKGGLGKSSLTEEKR